MAVKVTDKSFDVVSTFKGDPFVGNLELNSIEMRLLLCKSFSLLPFASVARKNSE